MPGLLDTPVSVDFVYGQSASGSLGQQLLNNDFNSNVLRPYVGDNGRGSYITVNDGHDGKGRPKYRSKLVGNAPATLRRDEWKLFDQALIRPVKEGMRAVSDLRAAGLQLIIPNGMGKTVLEYQTVGDITPATVSMDPARQSERDAPTYDIGGLPLFIIHKDFSFTARQLAVARNGGVPLDTTTAELATERVVEEAEKILLGVSGSFSYAGYTAYGYLTFPDRIVKNDITSPETGGWTADVLVSELLEMRQLSRAAFHRGPWVVYFSDDWDPFLDEDYSATKGDITTRDRLRRIDGISDVRTLDYLTGSYTIIMVEQKASTVRMVVGMEPQTIQWQTLGGMEFNFKVMTMMVPQLRADTNGTSGIVVGTTS